MQTYFHIVVFIIMVLVDSIKVGSSQRASKDTKIVIFTILLALYGGLRSPLSMVDNYANEFTLFQYMSFEDIFVNYATREPIYRCFVKLLGMISSNEQLLFLVQACIVSIGFGFFVKRRSTDPLLSFLVFFALRQYSFCLATMRQGIAIAIILGIADKYLAEKKLIKFIIAVVFASMFHNSALLFILAYPCYHLIKNTKRFIFIAFSLSVFFSIFGEALSYIVTLLPFLDKYNSYVLEEYYHSGVHSTLIIYTVVLIVSVLIIKQKEENQEQVERTQSLGVGMGFCGMFYGALSRCELYFTGYSAILFPLTLRIFKDYRLARYLLILILLFQFVIFGPGQGGRDYHFYWMPY